MKKFLVYLLLFGFTIKSFAQKFDNFMVTKEMLLEKFHLLNKQIVLEF